MKKFLIVLVVLFVLVGCTDITNTPSKKVSEYIGMYQTMDSKILEQLDAWINKDQAMNEKQKKEYKSLMEKQYQHLSYKIKDEKTKDDTATVDTEIQVYDYRSSIKASEEYLKEHKKEFYGKDKKVDNSKFIDYKLKKLKDVTEREHYTIEFNLKKVNKRWQIIDVTDKDIEKIHGLYKD